MTKAIADVRFDLYCIRHQTEDMPVEFSTWETTNMWRLLLPLFLIPPVHAHPLLDQVPPVLLNHAELKDDLCSKVNRIVVVDVTASTTYHSTTQQFQNEGYPLVYSLVQMDVVRQIGNLGPLVPNFTLRFDGGQIGNDYFSTSDGPSPRVGERWALAIRYWNNDYTANVAWVGHRVKVPLTQVLAPNSELTAAHTEYCNG